VVAAKAFVTETRPSLLPVGIGLLILRGVVPLPLYRRILREK
jgi:hypothetical protein